MKKTIKRWTAGVLVAAITFSGPVMPAEAKGKLAKLEIKQVTSESAGKLKVLYKKVPKQAKAQVQVSTDKKFKKNVRSKVARGTVKSITFKKLKAVTYYVRVRSFVTEKKKKKYSTWSSKKKISVTGAKTSTDTTEAEDTAADTGRTGTYPRTEEDLIRELWEELFRQNQNSSTGGSDSSNNNSSAGDNSSTGNNGSTGGNSEKDPNGDSGCAGGNTGENPTPIDISGFLVRVYTGYFCIYDGQAKCPEISVIADSGENLVQGTDFTVSYENNVNAGTALVRVKGVGRYTGELTETFEIDKAMPKMAYYGEEEAIVGQPLPIVFDQKPEGKCTYEVRRLNKEETTDQYTKVNENGELVAIQAGIVEINVKIEESENYLATDYSLGTLTICDEESPEGGFSPSTYAEGDTYKSELKGVTVENGKGSFDIAFESDASNKWLDEHMRFEVEDATPSAYRKAFEWLGKDTETLVFKVENSTKELRSRYNYGRDPIVGPCADQPLGDLKNERLSARKITVTVGEGVRVCKVKAYRDDKLYDVIYIATKPYDTQENYLDEEYYAQARHKVEAKIWTEDMTVLQKLNALAGYIRTTTHYPGSGSTKKETNPTFWNAFAVDGIQLYYYMYTMPTLNRIMDLQGGLTTCVGVDIIERAATEDLGLPYLYDADTKTVAEGEGVWLVRGSYSSNPSAAAHESVIYKDANERRTFIDAQGMIADTTCEEHGCLDKVIRD